MVFTTSCERSPKQDEDADADAPSTSEGQLRIVGFSHAVTSFDKNMRQLTVRVKNCGTETVQLRLYADDSEIHEELVERRRRSPWLQGPYALGLEVRYEGDQMWRYPTGYRWMPVEMRTEDKVSDWPPIVQIKPGETRSLCEFILSMSFWGRSYKTFILDPAGERIDERILIALTSQP